MGRNDDGCSPFIFLAFIALVSWVSFGNPAATLGSWWPWGNDLESQTKRMETFASKNKMGSDSDYFLVKYNLLNEWEKVALVFGFMNDAEFCKEVAEMYMQKYPLSKYSCVRANE